MNFSRWSYVENMMGVPRQLAGRALRSNLFNGEKPSKRIFTSNMVH
jgi:hypothetical protein